MRPAFYALSQGSWRDYVTLLHPPFTLWHLSYLALGAATAPVVYLDRLGWMVLAFFLAVGVGAHYLDELHDRPLGTQIPRPALLIIAVLSLALACLIGIAASLMISLWAVPFVLFGGFMVLAYNLELWDGWFHSDLWFALLWGGFPALVGYWANAETLGGPAILIAASCVLLSFAQRKLSNPVRRLRRNTLAASGRIVYEDGRSEAITISSLISEPERALHFLSFAVPLLALAWLLARL